MLVGYSTIELLGISTPSQSISKKASLDQDLNNHQFGFIVGKSTTTVPIFDYYRIEDRKTA